jgi:outer membrane protein
MLRSHLFSALAVCAAALAFTSTAAAQSKMGVVNFQQALLNTDEAKKAQNDLIAEFKPRQDEIDALARKLQDDQTKLQSSQGKLSPQGEAELSADIQHEQHQIQNMQQDLQDESNARRDQMVQKMGTRMTEIAAKLRDEKGLDVIMDSAAVIAFNKALDLTAEATAAYNKAYPVTASTGLAPAAPASGAK